jgi:hypothetical protein
VRRKNRASAQLEQLCHRSALAFTGPTPRERPIRAPGSDSPTSLKNCEIVRISAKYLDFWRSDLTQLRPATRSGGARMNLKAGCEVPGMKSRSQLQTAVSRRYQADFILLLSVYTKRTRSESPGIARTGRS